VTRVTHPQIRDFGFDTAESPYHFACVVSRAGEGDIRIEERFGFGSEALEPAREPVTKVRLDAYRWSRIAEATRAEFNRRLQEYGQPAVPWRTRETLLAPHLGKELTLLAWAVEDADPTVIPNMIANWRGLAPEERWWLYTTVNATSGHPEHGRDRGWRKAIKIALAENPSEAVTPGTVDFSENDAKQPAPTPRTSGPKARVAKMGPSSAQLTLLGEDRP
jgi:hypothetical protein